MYFQVYDSTIEHSPHYVYKVPEVAENIILTDKLIFFTSTFEGSEQLLHQLSVVANQMAEVAEENIQVKAVLVFAATYTYTHNAFFTSLV